MTIRSGRDPRDGNRRKPPAGDGSDRRFVDRGWDDYWPEDGDVQAERVAENRTRLRGEGYESRDYRSERRRGVASQAGFLLTTGVLVCLVLAGLYVFVRPPVLGAIADWAADNPTALNLPFVPDIVRGELGDSLTKPADAQDFREVQFEVAYGQTTYDIADRLVQAGLIRDRRAFVFEAITRGVTTDFIAGNHTLTRAMTVDQIIDAMTIPTPVSPLIRVTFREGLRIEQMVAKLEYIEANPSDPATVLQLDVKAYYEMAMHPPADLVAEYSWLKLPEGASLEGFLFPATYDLPVDITPRQLIEKQLFAFSQNAPAQLLSMPPDQIYHVVELASMVELEASLDTDRPLVAGVFANRLDPAIWPTGHLNSDPTVNYANDSVWLSSNPIESWVEYVFWKPIGGSTPYSQLDFPAQIRPYNTYQAKGLPPTPICSPGLVSLEAAVNPDTADGYLYFVAKNDGTGALAFAKTEAEHQANLKKYGYIP
jgi:UPF0755 protein